jgi:serine protease Do
MKKIALGFLLIFSVLALGACTTPTTTDDVDIETLVQSFLDENPQVVTDLVESYIDDNQVAVDYDLSAFEDDITSVVNDARGSVLGIVNQGVATTSTGSGVVYKYENGTYYLVTNEHVVDGFQILTIVYEKNGMLFEIDNDNITFIGADVTTDLAVLSFTSDEEFPTIEFADSYGIDVGQFVFAIGNPLGFDYYNTVTMGVISGLTRFVTTESGLETALLQHDAAISPGNSGGALIDTDGKLIGINNMKLVDTAVSNIGFAIPSNTVERIVTDLEDDGQLSRPYLGISSYVNVNTCGIDYGVCVSVMEGEAAASGGLETDDVIIGYMIQGQEWLDVYNFDDLREAILNSSVGDSIYIRYLRNEGTALDPNFVEYESTLITLGLHPDDR